MANAKVHNYNFQRKGCYIVSQSNTGSDGVHRKRIQAKFAISGLGMLVAGTILGQDTATKEYFPHDPTANNGTEIASAILYDKVNVGDTKAVGEQTHAPVDLGDMAVHGEYLVFAKGTTPTQLSDAINSLTDKGFTIRNMADITVPA